MIPFAPGNLHSPQQLAGCELKNMQMTCAGLLVNRRNPKPFSVGFNALNVVERRIERYTCLLHSEALQREYDLTKDKDHRC